MQNYPGYHFNLPAKKKSVLRYQPPGFEYSIDIPFPGRVLPVCQRCKKNYKTREHCRVKEGHTGLPWTDTYICITFDNSCFSADGNLIQGQFVASGMSPQPFVYQASKLIDPKTPSCAQCKDKNYTRTYCRASKKHKTLPWSTVYVMLSLRENAAPPIPGQEVKKRRKLNDNVDANPSQGITKDSEKKDETPVSLSNSDGKGKESNTGTSDGKDSIVKGEELNDSVNKTEKDTSVEGGKNNEGNKVSSEMIFGKIHQSRTFLSTVSITKNEVEWVDLDQNQASYMSHRQKQQESVAAAASDMPSEAVYSNPYMMQPGNMASMGLNMHSLTYPAGLSNPPVAGQKQEDPNRPNSGINGMEGQWMGGGPGVSSHHAGQFPEMMSQMMDPRLMDPRMGGYGYPSWTNRGYPMDMSPSYSGYGAPQNPYGQYSSMVTSGGQNYPGDLSNITQLGQGIGSQALSPQGMQQMQQQMGMSQNNMQPQSFAQQVMGQGSIPVQNAPTLNKDDKVKSGGNINIKESAKMDSKEEVRV